MRLNEWRETLRSRLLGDCERSADADDKLASVLTLMAGPGRNWVSIRQLDFGRSIVWRPAVLSRSAVAVKRRGRGHRNGPQIETRLVLRRIEQERFD